MPDVPYANTLRVVCRQTFLGEESVNVWHVRTTDSTALNATRLNEIAGAFEGFYVNPITGTPPGRGIRQYLPSNSTYVSTKVYDLRTVPNPVVFERVASIAGGATLDVTPADMACTVTLRTAVGTRRGRGRIFLGPLAGCLAAGTATLPPQFTQTFITDVGDAVVDLQDALDLLNIAPGPYRIAVLSVADALSRNVDQIRIDRRPDTQRRRDLDMTFSQPEVRTVG